MISAMKPGVVGVACAIVVGLECEAGTQVLFDTGPERQVMFDAAGACNHALTYLGWSSGQICNPDCANDTQPQRRCAQAFTLPDGDWDITEIWASGFLPAGSIVETLSFQIFSRTALDVAPTEADSVATGSVPLPTPQQHPDGGQTNSLYVMNVELNLSGGDYWLTIWGENSDPNLFSNFAWFTNAENGINNVDVVGNAYMWRASMYPAPGFQVYQLDSCMLMEDVGGDPDDLYNASFRIIGEERVGLCPWDCEASPDGSVGVLDLLALLAQWGDVGSSCDFGDPGVGVLDLLDLLANWGMCP